MQNWDVLHTTTNGKQKFHILAETRTELNGEQTSSWSIDFSQLSAFYSAAGVDEKKRVPNSRHHVGKNF